MKITAHPNAGVSLASGGGFAYLVWEAVSELGYNISAPLAIWMAGGISAAALFIGRNGVEGVFRVLKNGTGGKPDA